MQQWGKWPFNWVHFQTKSTKWKRSSTRRETDSTRFSSIRQTRYDPSSFLWSNRLARLGSRACVTRSDFQYVQSSVPIADASQFHVLAIWIGGLSVLNLFWSRVSEMQPICNESSKPILNTQAFFKLGEMFSISLLLPLSHCYLVRPHGFRSFIP